MGDNYMIYVFNWNNTRNIMRKFTMIGAEALSHLFSRVVKMET